MRFFLELSVNFGVNIFEYTEFSPPMFNTE